MDQLQLYDIRTFQEISKKQNYQITDFSTKLEAIRGELSIKEVKSENVEKAYKILSHYGIQI